MRVANQIIGVRRSGIFVGKVRSGFQQSNLLDDLGDAGLEYDSSDETDIVEFGEVDRGIDIYVADATIESVDFS